MHRQELLSLLYNYRTRFIEEKAYVSKAISFVQAHEDCFYRELWPMHVTGSTWVVNQNRDKVLMLHHRKLDQWFQPGGHADGDADILRVALKETTEETGIRAEEIKLVTMDVFDVDIHSIPTTGSDPAHEHIDIRFLVEINDSLPVPGNDESHEVLWIDLREVCVYNNNRSTYRMIEKTRYMRNFAAQRRFT